MFKGTGFPEAAIEEDVMRFFGRMSGLIGVVQGSTPANTTLLLTLVAFRNNDGNWTTAYAMYDSVVAATRAEKGLNGFRTILCPRVKVRRVPDKDGKIVSIDSGNQAQGQWLLKLKKPPQRHGNEDIYAAAGKKDCPYKKESNDQLAKLSEIVDCRHCMVRIFSKVAMYPPSYKWV